MCTFSLAGHRFGVDVVDVQEVVRARPLTRVPLARPDVAGLLNLRGRILTVLDLRMTKVTPQGLAALRAALPKCKIEHDGGGGIEAEKP